LFNAFKFLCFQKKFTELENKNKEIQDLLNSATVKLNSCLEEKAGVSATLAALKEQMII